MRRSYIVRRHHSTKIDIRYKKNLLLRWGGVHENPQHCGPPSFTPPTPKQRYITSFIIKVPATPRFYSGQSPRENGSSQGFLSVLSFPSLTLTRLLLSRLFKADN